MASASLQQLQPDTAPAVEKSVVKQKTEGGEVSVYP